MIWRFSLRGTRGVAQRRIPLFDKITISLPSHVAHASRLISSWCWYFEVRHNTPIIHVLISRKWRWFQKGDAPISPSRYRIPKVMTQQSVALRKATRGAPTPQRRYEMRWNDVGNRAPKCLSTASIHARIKMPGTPYLSQKMLIWSTPRCTQEPSQTTRLPRMMPLLYLGWPWQYVFPAVGDAIVKWRPEYTAPV